MAEKLRLEVYTPQGLVLNEEVDEVEGPGFNGSFGLLPQHTQYFVLLKIGVLSYRKGSEWKGLVIDSGYAVVEENTVKVVVSEVELVDSINYEKQVKEKERIEGEKKEIPTFSQEFLNFDTAYKKTLARIQAYEKYVKKG